MKRLIMMTSMAVAIGCSADITPEDVKVADYKDGKECAVSLTFDDSMKEHYTIVAPELEKRGFRGTFWMVGAWMPAVAEADTTHFTWAEAKEMSDRGHEMSNHTWSHPYMTMLSDEDLLNEIKKNDEAILANIGKPSTTFCFPYNAFNEKVIAAAMEGRVGARLKEFWLGGQNSPKEYLHKQVEDALASGSWIAGMTHGINYGYDCYSDPTDLTDSPQSPADPPQSYRNHPSYCRPPDRFLRREFRARLCRSHRQSVGQPDCVRAWPYR